MAREVQEINSSSMADIAFLLLIYFLMTTTMDQDSGLRRQLPPMPANDQEVQDQKINRRNIITVKINSMDRIFAGNTPIEVSMLKEKIKEFLLNPNDDPKLPEKKMKEIEGFGSYPVSNGVISLQNDRGTSYKTYIAVQNEIVKAINEIRDDFSRSNWGVPYARLDETKQGIVREAIPQQISEAEPKDVTSKN